MTDTTFTIPTLQTDRLILRAHKVEDIEHEVEFFKSDRSHLSGGPLTREGAFRAVMGFLGHWALRGYGFWAVEEKATGKYVGRVGLWFPAGWPEKEIGWSLMNGAEGKGFAYEAAIAARAYAYETLGWKTAVSMILHGNTRSVALAEKMGATLDSDFEHERFGPCHIYRHLSPEATL